MTDTIYLDPDLFMALGLSAEAFGGIGTISAFWDDSPCCIVGHAAWLDGEDRIYGWEEATPTERALWNAFPWRDYPRSRLTEHNDGQILKVTHDTKARVPFARWCEIVGVDVAE